MKKLIALLLAAVMVMSLAACGGGNAPASSTPSQAAESSEAEATPTPVPRIALTKANIEDYVAFDGEFTDGDYHSISVARMKLGTISEAVLNFQAYGTTSGTFSNVEIEVEAIIDRSQQGLVYNWHLADTEDEAVVFSFKMPANGSFSKKYEVECKNNTNTLSGTCDFKVLSVSGEFIPN